MTVPLKHARSMIDKTVRSGAVAELERVTRVPLHRETATAR